MKLILFAKRLIRALEDPKIGFGNYILTFVFVMTLRNFLEMFSDNENISFLLFSHYYLSYICLAMALIVLFYFAVKQKVESIARVVLPFFIVLVLAPMLDLIISLGKGHDISYMLPGKHENLLRRFFTYFGPYEDFGVSPGMRIEIGLVLVMCTIYFYIKTENILRSLLFCFLSYSLIFFYGMMPYVVKYVLSVFGLEFSYSAVVMRNFYLLLIFILTPWLYYLHNRKHCIEILKDLRYLRVLHFVLMSVLGIVLSQNNFELTDDTLFHLIFMAAAILFASLFSLITNNLVDYDIDKITNKKRPSVSKTLSTAHYMKLAWIAFILAMVYSLAISFTTMFLILLFIAIYFLYSMPPFRLKRVPVFSKFLIALNSLVIFISGYLLVGGKMDLPFNIIAFCFVGFTAVINFIDIKDYEGDKIVGIKTLPTMLGVKRSKQVIGLFFLMVYPLSYFVLNDTVLLIPSIITGLVIFFLVNRKDYDERPIFIVYLASIIMLIIYLVMFAGMPGTEHTSWPMEPAFGTALELVFTHSLS